MLSSDQNIELLSQLLADIKKYLELRGECMKIDLVHKLCKLFTALVLGAVFFLIGALALLFLTFFLVDFLSPYVGGEVVSNALIVGMYLLLGLLVYAKRRAWVETPLTRFIARTILTDPFSKSAEGASSSSSSSQS